MTSIPVRDSAGRTDPAGGLTPFFGRAFIAAIFLFSGFGKAASPGPTISYIESSGLPFPELALGVAVLVEVAGGILLLAGCQTKPVAAALAVFSLAAAFGFHFQLADQNQFIHFFKNVAIAGGLLQVVAFGAGRIALDSRR